MKIMKIIFLVICLMIIAWWLVSYVDVMIYQFNGGTGHSWNIFKMLVN